MSNNQFKAGSEFLVQFLDQFTGLMEHQLKNVRSTMEGTVDHIMEGVKNISRATELGRQSAEKTLEKTYLNPDIETQVLVDELQQMIDTVFDEAKDKMERGIELTNLDVAEPEVLLNNRIKRFTSKFKSEMSEIDHLDKELADVIMGMIAALSSEDVIAQKLDHVIMSLKVLQTGLNYVLIDYENRCNTEELSKVTNDICHYTFRQYTCEDEKVEFSKYFPNIKAG
ncbi:MAG: hypothetical protein HRU19_21285 [Pseudobacteriovorax sp.]|nr:hypothetical protein [Gammaproteobacteria bacterium]NRA67036.1 hypothetical protein [Pseudobacteriovorax sp.]